MVLFDYSREPRSDIAFIDIKSFYASVECIEKGLHPLKTSLCVMSRSPQASGLILASSPVFKEVFGRKNVGRSYDLPFDIESRRFSYQNARKQGLSTEWPFVSYIESWAKSTLIVPPRMDLYIEKNIEIQKIFQNYAALEDIHPYSIDEGFIDLTSSLDYFVREKGLTRREKLDLLSSQIQKEIYQKTGLFATVGMSNANPLLAKLALDNEAKTASKMRANWSYEDVEAKVWSIPKLTDFWGIGSRMEKRLESLEIYSIRDLAHADPDMLKKELGVVGLELFCHAHGIDESNVHNPYSPKERGIGNSQILPRDYQRQKDIELVLMEMAEQVAIRLRRAGKKAGAVSIHVSYSRKEGKRSLQAQMKVEPTNVTRELVDHVLALFRKKYQQGAVRSIAVRYTHLVDESYTLLSLFEDPEAKMREGRLERTIDELRGKFGYTAVLKANALTGASRAIERSRLVGGHSAGGLEGLE